MPRGKPRKDKVAAAAAAAAAAAVKATQDASVKLNWASDADDDENAADLTDEMITGLEQIAEDSGEVVWELYADTPIEKAGQIRKLATSELRRVRDECLGYGPGEYHVIARKEDGTFAKGSRTNIKISAFAARTIPLPNAPLLDPATLIAQIEERAEKRRLEAKRERDQELRFWAPILAPVGVELAKGLMGRGGGGSVKELVEALVGAKQLIGGGTSDVDTLLKGIELARDLEPAKANGSTWQDVLLNGVRELRPLAENLVSQRRVNQTNTPVQLHTAPVAALPAAAAATAAAPTAATGNDPMLTMIEPLLQRLATELEEYAANGAEPGLAAEALLAKVPRMISSQVQPAQMKEWLTQPNWWEWVLKFRPSLTPYQGFCDDVRLGLLSIFEAELNPPSTSQGEPEEE